MVLGASTNPARYAFTAVLKLKDKGHIPIPIGLKKGTIRDVEILPGKPDLHDVHTVTIYLRPALQKPLYGYILGLHPKRIIFNPGTENPEFEDLASSQGIEVERACTLVMLSMGIF